MSSTTKSFWRIKQNQKEFLDKLAKQLHIKEPKQWGTVTKRQVIDLGGKTLLCNYEDSLWKILQSVYPGMNLLRITK